jgi:hypothetical protein
MVQKCNRTSWSSDRTVFSFPLSLVFMETPIQPLPWRGTKKQKNKKTKKKTKNKKKEKKKKKCCGILGTRCKQNTTYLSINLMLLDIIHRPIFI